MSYYDAWKSVGLGMPPQPEDVRDWHETVGLESEEDYLIDGSIRKVSMGLGWDAGCDVDGSAALFNADGQKIDSVWWQKLQSECGAVKHSGDDRTGEGGGDDEVIKVDLAELDLDVHYLMFVVCVFTESMSFSEVRKAYVRMMHDKGEMKNHVLFKYDLSEMSGNAMIVGVLSRRGAYWKFKALGLPAVGHMIHEVIEDPAACDALHSIKTFPPHLRHLYFRVKAGRGLVAKDNHVFGSGKSDPFVKIKFKGKKELSGVKKKTLEPEWDMDMIDLGCIAETEHKAIKITVWDHDKWSKNEFMGAIRLPAAACYNMGPGTFNWWMPLTASKKEKYESCRFGGEILVETTLIDQS